MKMRKGIGLFELYDLSIGKVAPSRGSVQRWRMSGNRMRISDRCVHGWRCSLRLSVNGLGQGVAIGEDPFVDL